MDDPLNNLLVVALLLLPVVIGALAAASHRADLAKRWRGANACQSLPLRRVKTAKRQRLNEAAARPRRGADQRASQAFQTRADL